MDDGREVADDDDAVAFAVAAFEDEDGIVAVVGETSQHEPTVALYGGGPDGLDIPIDVLVRSVALLRTGGVLVMEHDHEQGALLRAAALGAGFKQAETGQDLTGRDRYLRAVR